jgi:hypothetical protein
MKIMGWRPPQRPQWLKEIMKTPGPIKVQLLLLTTLTISSVTSTALQICNRVGNTSEENILASVESLEVAKEGLRLRVTGRSTTEVLQSLKQTLNILENSTLNEK